MADQTVVAANVKYGFGATLNPAATAGTGGITQGQLVYKVTSTGSDQGKYLPCTTASAEAANCAGMAVTPAAADGIFAFISAGQVYTGDTFAIGDHFEVGTTAGLISDAGDAGSGEYCTSVGIADSTTSFLLKINATGQAHA